MKIKEVCQKTGLTDRAVRFYIDNGLVSPSFTENYTGRRAYDFSKKDIEVLNKIIVYRKLGIPVESIKQIFNGKIDLQNAVKESMNALQSEVEKLNGSIELCKEVIKNNESDISIDQQYYLNLIADGERKGKQFADVLKDYSEFEKNLLLKYFQPFTTLSKVVDLEKVGKKGKWYAVLFVLLICTGSGFAGEYIWKYGFAAGFFRPFLLFAIMSVILLPYFIFKDRSEKAVRIWSRCVLMLFYVISAVMIAFVVFLIVHLISDIVS